MRKEYSFTEVHVEPCAGADLSAMVREMCALSKKIELPVITEFNGHEITVTSDTDPVSVANEYFFAHCSGSGKKRKENK